VAINAEAVVLDIGYKTEGLLPLTELRGSEVKKDDKLRVTIKGRDPEGYYELTLGKVQRVTDWEFAQRRPSTTSHDRRPRDRE